MTGFTELKRRPTQVTAMTQNYDLMIIGTGPAGLSAALYGARLGLNTIVFGDIPGGNTQMIEKLDNFPGFPDGIAGPQFGVFSFQQAQQQGASFTMVRLQQLSRIDHQFVGTDASGRQYRAPCVIVATGRLPRRLAVPKAGLQGIHFCSLCDGPLYRGKNATVAVVGDDNTAAQHAATLSRLADKVLLITRGSRFSMDDSYRKRLEQQDNVELLADTEVIAYEGNETVTGLTVRRSDQSTGSLAVSGVFLVIGWRPNTKMIDWSLETTGEGYIKTDAKLMSSCAGLFAAGDVRDTDMRQVLTACADGARAAKYGAEFLENLKSLQ